MSRTGTVPQLFGHVPEPTIDLAVTDAQRRLVDDGDFVQVTSRRGSQVFRARVSDAMRGGQAFVPDALGRGVRLGCGTAATASRHDDGRAAVRSPDSRQPELKHAAVRHP